MTFLFSDIEGSTERWERDPGVMAAALTRHNELLRDAIETHGGHVFKVMGDAVRAVFATVPEATAAALGAQRALLIEDFSAVGGIRVRIALHTGHAHVREGDYVGPTLNRIARLVAIGHGGQILISGPAAALLQDAVPSDSVLRDLGAHRLKDLARPEHVYHSQPRICSTSFRRYARWILSRTICRNSSRRLWGEPMPSRRSRTS